MAETGAVSNDDGMCWCLRRLGGSQDILLLPEGEEVSLGRGFGVTYQLSSTASPLMISRTHCFLRQNAEGQWTITDNNSLNGVFLNKEKLKPQSPYVVPRGGGIQLGVVMPNAERAEFEYELVQENLEQIRPLLTRPQSGKKKPSRSKRKLNCDDSEASGTEGTSSMFKAKIPRVLTDGSEPSRSPRTEISKQPTVRMETSVELDSSIDVDLVAATQAPAENSLHVTKIRQSLVELENVIAQVKEKMKTIQESGSPEGRQELLDLQKELCDKHEEHLQTVSELRTTDQEAQGSMGTSSRSGEDCVTLAQIRAEYSQLLDDLSRSRQDLELIIQVKNKEQETKEKMEAQEEVLHHMNDVLDNELQCIICSEHFIEAVTLNCAHSFCAFCIQAWRKRKEECPICRQQITSQTRSLVLDNCITRMVDKLSPEMKDHRLAVTLERKDLAVVTTPVPAPSDSEGSPFSEFSALSSSEDMEDPLEMEDDVSDSEEIHSFFSEDEFDSDDRGDLFSDGDMFDDDDDDDDYIFFSI